MLTVLDLFSGIGGFSLGLERAGMKTVAFCEIEEFPRKVLAKHWPDVPIFNDVRALRGEDVGAVDVVCGGFPCQPFSTAGKRGGATDDRHLWPEMLRLIREIRPSFVIGENVAGFISMALDDVSSDLEGIGYKVESVIVPACAVGRNHRRNRVWIIAYALRGRMQKSRHTPGVRGERNKVSWHGICQDAAPPRVVRSFDGIPHGLDRLRGLGNAVAPQIPEMIGRAIIESMAS